MHLALDIGNTTISMAILNGQRVSRVGGIDVTLPKAELKKEFQRFLQDIKKDCGSIQSCIACSVVPDINRLVENQIAKTLDIKILFVGRDVNVPIENKYRNKKQVGHDRLVGAYAVKMLYGQPAVIVDFGTAITFDVLNSAGEYEGGIIVPGIRLSIESLSNKTALLPQIEHITAPNSLIGKNTKESMLSGIFYGYGAMCSGLIDQVSSQIKENPVIIVTGGYTHLMRRFMASKITKIDKNLVFKGLALLCKNYLP